MQGLISNKEILSTIRLTIILSVENWRLFNILHNNSITITAFPISGATRGRTRRNRYHKLGLKSIENRRWYRKLCWLFKAFKSQSPKYLFKTTPIFSRIYRTKNANNIPLFKVEHTFFKRCFFSFTVL